MIKCPKCGKEYRDDAVFCTDCGIRLHEQYTAPNTDAGADSDQHAYTDPRPYRRGIPQQRSLRPRRTL